MTSTRGDALNKIIQSALEKRIVSIRDVTDSMEGEPSRRTIRRAFKDAEEYGWLKKQAANSNSWYSGDIARKYQQSDRVDGYPHDNFPIMYYVVTNTTPQPFFDGENVLASAGVAWRESGSGFTLGIPNANHLLIDSGGYQAAARFRDEYPYSPQKLHEWAHSVHADVVFGMDWACEDKEVLSKITGVAEEKIADWEWRYEKAWQDQVKQFEHYQQGRYDHEFRPVIQGHDKEDFIEFAHKLKDSHLPHRRVGVGTICKRASTDEIYDVVSSIKSILPHSDLHLFGATLNIWKDERFENMYKSSDSAAWLQHDPDSGMYAEDMEQAYLTYKNKVENSALGRKS